MLNGYYGIETLLPDIIIQNLAFFSSCEYLLSKATGNSNSRNDIILDTTESASTWEIDVRYM